MAGGMCGVGGDLVMGNTFGRLFEIGCGPAASIALFAAVHNQVADAFDTGVEIDDVLRYCACADDGLDGRAGLVSHLGGAVEERIVDVIGGQLLIEVVEAVEVVGGIGDQGTELAGGNVDDDGRAVHLVLFDGDALFSPGDLPEDILDGVLELDVNGEFYGAALLRFLLGKDVV